MGYYLDRQDHTREQAVSSVGYNPGEGTVVRVEGVQASPTAVRPGETVNLMATYSILTPAAGQSVLVRETREVRHDGALVANPTTEVTRANGTFTSAVPITLAAGSPRGAYEVLTTVQVDGRLSRSSATFRVQ